MKIKLIFRNKSKNKRILLKEVREFRKFVPGIEV